MASWGDLSWRKRNQRDPRAFDPYNPTVPAGSYDPGLDSALYAAQRGLQDLTADTQTQQQRGLIDFGLGRDDLTQQRDRGLQDLGTSRSRGEQDYSTNVGLLTRKYGNLASVQSEQQNRYGVTSGGAMLQAAAKRKANQGLEQTQLDTTRNRFLDDNTLAQTRLGEDYTSQSAKLGLGLQRGTDDSGLALLRGQRELGQFGIDTQGQRLFQASQANYVAPTKPKNEFTTAAGVPYRVIKVGNKSIRVDQFGRRI